MKKSTINYIVSHLKTYEYITKNFNSIKEFREYLKNELDYTCCGTDGVLLDIKKAYGSSYVVTCLFVGGVRII